jgi:hypothetical protein
MKVPQPLIDDIQTGKCLPFIGAGFSLNARMSNGKVMPDWKDLTQQLAGMSGVDAMLGGPAVASAFERQFGRVQLIESIRKALHPHDSEPGSAHFAFGQLPFDTIYTTNFDLLLESAFVALKKPFRSIVGELQMPFHGGSIISTIIKMHGDLRHEEHIVVTSQDYDRYLTDYPVIATHLSAQLITKTGLFIGYSLTDPDFTNIRRIIRSRLGKFERMAYLTTFDSAQKEIDDKLSDNLHVISLVASNGGKEAALAKFFNEISKAVDAQESIEIRAARPDAFEPLEKEIVKRTALGGDASQLFRSSSNLCFVLMPFNPSMDLVYRELIKPSVEFCGLTAVRADELHSPGVITEQIRAAIQQSRLCIADLTDNNPNVLYEVGIAHTLNKPTLLITGDRRRIPFNIAANRLLIYHVEDLGKSQVHLKESIQNILGSGMLAEARVLIDQGMYRAAAAVLGMLLEQSMIRLADKNSSLLPSVPNKRILSLRSLLDTLKAGKILSPDELAGLQDMIQLRNQAVHALVDTTAQDAAQMLEIVSAFIRNHFPGQWL